MALLETLDDKSWAMLDWLWDKKMPIGAVFEKYNIPATLFPLSVILVLLLAFWMLSAPVAGDSCGDGSCTPPESCVSCPDDCGICDDAEESGAIVSIEIGNKVKEAITVTIFDEAGARLAEESGRKSLFEFAGIAARQISATVACPNGKEQRSSPRNLNSDEKRITLFLPEDCFDTLTGDRGDPVPTFGNVHVKTYDALTSDAIDARVSVVRVSDGISETSATTDFGEATLNVKAQAVYYLQASADGYESYSAKSDTFYMVAGALISKELRLEPLADPSEQAGSIRVCAVSSSGPIESGRISLQEVGGVEIDSATLSEASSCASFAVAAGKIVKATLTSPPAGCTASGFSDEVMIESASEESVQLDVNCGREVAYLKIIVRNMQGEVLTENVTVTLWDAVLDEIIPGSASDSSLALASGGYTEELTVPVDRVIRAKATSPPPKYVDTTSGPITLEAGEHGSIDIILGERDVGRFSFQGASLIYTPAAPGSPVKVYVQEILYNGTVLTSQNSDVVVKINGEEFDATYEEA